MSRISELFQELREQRRKAFMPFVTEAIYQQLPFKEKDFLMVENWPE